MYRVHHPPVNDFRIRREVRHNHTHHTHTTHRHLENYIASVLSLQQKQTHHKETNTDEQQQGLVLPSEIIIERLASPCTTISSIDQPITPAVAPPYFRQNAVCEVGSGATPTGSESVPKRVDSVSGDITTFEVVSPVPPPLSEETKKLGEGQLGLDFINNIDSNKLLPPSSSNKEHRKSTSLSTDKECREREVIPQSEIESLVLTYSPVPELTEVDSQQSSTGVLLPVIVKAIQELCERVDDRIEEIGKEFVRLSLRIDHAISRIELFESRVVKLSDDNREMSQQIELKDQLNSVTRKLSLTIDNRLEQLNTQLISPFRKLSFRGKTDLTPSPRKGDLNTSRSVDSSTAPLPRFLAVDESASLSVQPDSEI